MPNIDISWTEDSKRKALPCAECKKPTKGREQKKAICMECVFAIVFKEGVFHVEA